MADPFILRLLFESVDEGTGRRLIQSQFITPDAVPRIVDLGVATVVDLTGPGEASDEERQAAADALAAHGISCVHVPVTNPQAMHEACDAVGRPRTEIRTSVQVVLYLGEDERATAVMNGPLAPRAVTGSAQRLIDTLGAYAEAGFDDFIVPDWVLGRDAAERRDGLDRLWNEVLSHV